MFEATARGMPRGFMATYDRYGTLMGPPQTAIVNGHAYNTGSPATPEQLEARAVAAEEAWGNRIWRDDLRYWREEIKPASHAANRALAGVDLSALSDSELAGHLDACQANLELMAERHHWFNGAAMLPVGDFAVHAAAWGAGTPAELLGLLQGSAAASAGQCSELAALASAIRADEGAAARLMGDDAGRVLNSLRAHGGEVGRAMEDVVAFCGLRPIDMFDIAEPLVIEQPEVLVAAIRHAVGRHEGDSGATAASVEAATESIRARLPEEHRTEFDDLLAEARLVYGLRDERGLYQDVWAIGIARYAVLEAGRRLVARGRLHDAEHLIEATAAEMRGLLLDGDGPSADELAAARTARANRKPEDAPATIGDVPGQPASPPHDLPPGMARTMNAFMFAAGAMFGSGTTDHGDRIVRGLAVTTGVYEGTARIIEHASDLDRITEGDVLVTTSTGEAFNLVLPVLGAIVTDLGGILSHAAIVAREFGLPAVVGCRDATRLIPDGARVRVDAAAGEVHVL